jgi:GTP cyclohydrolase-4
MVASGVRRSWHASETRRPKDVSWVADMGDELKLLTEDLQASPPEVRLGLSRAGVTGVNKAIRIRHGETEKLIAANIACTVDLDPAQKGVHMSRFPELFEEAIDEVVIREAFLVEVLAEHIAGEILGRQQALRAEVEIVARYPLERTTPVTGLPTQAVVALIGIATASKTGVRRIVGVEATGINACPCAQGLVRDRASDRLLEAGFDEGDVDRILELVPLATHNQRGRGKLYVGTAAQVNAEQLVRIVERSMSSPVYELLKRPDELFVVEHAHLQPRFVEDSVRAALKETLETYPDLSDDDFVYSRQLNLETIHNHDVVAERYGTVGELRAELANQRMPTRHTELRDWLSH